MLKKEKILVLDFGGQYNQLIARRIRECNVYSEVKPFTMPVEEIKEAGYKGIIFTGGPSSVLAEDAPSCSPEILKLGIPVMGICYGAQLMAHLLGGSVEAAMTGEYGKTEITLQNSSPLFVDVPSETTCWMSHTYCISAVPAGFEVTAKTMFCGIAAMENKEEQLYAVQFHPEVAHTPEGSKMLSNFLFDVCGCTGDWKMSSFVNEAVDKIRLTVGDQKVLCALSGGVDSSVAAVMVHRAVGSQLTCIFVDHGLLRKNEADDVETVFKKRFNINLIRVDARERFLARLAGVTDPETKRKIIGEEFIRVFEEEGKKLGKVEYLVQGTIYPDVIESGIGDAAVIKSHHNVGGLPENIGFKGLVEPLRDLFKDEVRRAGLELEIPEPLVWRQPFPGPGLGIRVIGEITEEKLALLREADAIFREEIANAGLDRDINQYFAVLTNMRSVGVMGDERTYDYALALRGVTTTDFMTADWARIPYNVLEKASSRIINEVSHINRIVYDITSKPPSTIEWE